MTQQTNIQLTLFNDKKVTASAINGSDKASDKNMALLVARFTAFVKQMTVTLPEVRAMVYPNSPQECSKEEWLDLANAGFQKIRFLHFPLDLGDDSGPWKKLEERT